MVESVRWMSGSDDSEMTSAPDARPESESFGIRSVRLPLRCVGGGRRSTVSLIVSSSFRPNYGVRGVNYGGSKMFF